MEEEVWGSCQDKTLSAMVACFGGNASKFGIESESSPEKKRGYRAGKPYPTKKTIDRGPQYRRSSRVGSSSVLFYSQQHTESEESHENNKKRAKNRSSQGLFTNTPYHAIWCS